MDAVPFCINPKLDPTELARSFASTGRIHIPDFLDEAGAELLSISSGPAPIGGSSSIRGIVCEEGSGIAQSFVPAFNALNLFAVPQPHSVGFVTPFAARRRYSVTGWLRGREPPA